VRNVLLEQNSRWTGNKEKFQKKKQPSKNRQGREKSHERERSKGKKPNLKKRVCRGLDRKGEKLKGSGGGEAEKQKGGEPKKKKEQGNPALEKGSPEGEIKMEGTNIFGKRAWGKGGRRKQSNITQNRKGNVKQTLTLNFQE